MPSGQIRFAITITRLYSGAIIFSVTKWNQKHAWLSNNIGIGHFVYNTNDTMKEVCDGIMFDVLA
jgi:hypothetical protein